MQERVVASQALRQPENERQRKLFTEGKKERSIAFKAVVTSMPWQSFQM